MRKKNICLLCGITFLQGMVFYAAVATLYRQAAGLGILAITAIEGFSVALALLLEIPWGRAADRIGYRRTMIVCSVLFLVTKVIFWQADSFADFLLERLLLAVVISGLSGTDAGMLYLSAPPEDAQRNEGFYYAAGEAGVLLSGLMYTAFLSGQYRRAALWTVIAYAAAAVLSLFLDEVRPEEETKEKRSFLGAARAHFRAPGMVPLILCGALFSESTHCVTVYFSQLQYVRAGLSERAIGAAFVLVSAMGLCSPLSARVTERLGAKRSGIRFLLLASACTLVLSCTSSGILSVLLIAGVSVLSALFMPLHGTLENDAVTLPDRATALSMNAMVADSLIVVLDIGLGRAAENSLPLALAACCVCCAAAAGLFAAACARMKTDK